MNNCVNIFIFSDINECASYPCQNNGRCMDLINEYKCYCTNGYIGTNCTNDTCKYGFIHTQGSRLLKFKKKKKERKWLISKPGI